MAHHDQFHEEFLFASIEVALSTQQSASLDRYCARKVVRDLPARRNRSPLCCPSRSKQSPRRNPESWESFSPGAIRRERVRQCVRSSSCPHISTASRIEGAEPRNLSATLANLSAASVT